MIILKQEKKERIIRKQKYRNILVRNRKINRVNIFILGSGLLLIFLDYDQAAFLLIWTGVAIFLYTTFSGIYARRSKT